MTISITGAALLVTTVCDRRCPRCCYGLNRSDGPLGLPRHEPWSYFAEVAPSLRGIDTLYVTGGEPTLHPEFARIAQEFRAMFSPRRMVLATNGARVIDHAAVVHHFDTIKITGFADGAAPKACSWLQAHFPGKLVVESPAHRPMTGTGAKVPCNRQQIPAIASGRVYPCCVAPGIRGAASLPLGARWYGEVVNLAPPCERCPFANDGIWHVEWPT